MSNQIHPRAVVEDGAQLGTNNQIGPNAFIQAGAVLGDNNCLGPGAVVLAGTMMGSNNRLHTGAVLGDIPQDVAFKGWKSYLRIGDNNTFRENCTIHRGTAEESSTVVGNDNFLMVNSHLGHNCVIGNSVIMANNAAMGGYVEIGDRAFVSGGVVVHQFCRIGRLAIISGLTAISKDIPPFMLCMGKPGLLHGINFVGLRRAGIDQADRTELKRAYKTIFRSGLSLHDALEKVSRENKSALCAELINFIKDSKRGIAMRPTRESQM